MCTDRFFHGFPGHAQRNAQPLVHLGVHIHGYRAAEHQRVDHTPVDVPGQNDFISPLAGGKHHALHRAGGAAHHQEGVGRTESLGRKLLRFPNDGHGMTQVIQWLHAVYIHIQAFLPQKGGQLRIPPAVLMTGHIKGDHAHLTEALQCLINWSAALIHTHFFHRIILLSSSDRQQKTQVVRIHIPAFPNESEQ